MTNAQLRTTSEPLDEEFNRFIYAVSHDFYAPLRHIREFHNLLLAKLGEKVGEEEKLYVDMIQRSVEEMEEMLEELLKISRVKTHHAANILIDMRALIEKALEEIYAEIGKNNIIPQIEGEFCAILANPTLINTAIIELLTNAVMYRRQGHPLQLKIEGTVSPDTLSIDFIDNGRGIPPHFQPDVFTIFRKLHSEEHHEGSGAGLTLARSIAQHYGGGLTLLETKEGEGSTLRLQLKR